MISAIKILAIAAVGALISAPCLVAQSVVTDYNHTSSAFKTYRTYTWGKIHATDALAESRITVAVDRDLKLKGWHEVSKNADVIITAVDETADPLSYRTFYDSLGPGYSWGGEGFGSSVLGVDQIALGSLVIDMYDGKSKQLIWRGLANDTPIEKEKNGQTKVNENKTELNVDKTVDKMLADFPWKD